MRRRLNNIQTEITVDMEEHTQHNINTEVFWKQIIVFFTILLVFLSEY